MRRLSQTKEKLSLAFKLKFVKIIIFFSTSALVYSILAHAASTADVEARVKLECSHGAMAGLPNCEQIVRSTINKNTPSIGNATGKYPTTSVSPTEKNNSPIADDPKPSEGGGDGQRKLIDAENKKIEDAKDQKARDLAIANERERNSRELEIEAAKEAKIRQDRRFRELKSQDPKERQSYNHDQPIALDALNSVNKKGKFSPERAQQVEDRELKEKLLTISLAQKAKDEYHKAGKEIGLQIGELASMAAKLAAASMALNETKSGESVKGQLANSVSQKNSSISSPNEPDGDIDQTKLPDIEDSKSADQTKKSAQNSPEPKRALAKDLSLKDKLIAQLKAAEASENKGAGDVASGVNKNSKRENSAAKVASDVLTPPTDTGGDYNASGSSKTSGSFSLATSETNSEVKRLTDDADRQLTAADDTKAGILEVDSSSLFERVTARITGCLRQRCVNSKSLAQN